MTKRKNTRSTLASMLMGFAGQANSLVIPRPFIALCKGGHLAALLLSQILYWQDRTDDPNGWFSKSYEDWDDELGLTESQVKRLIRGDKRAKNPELIFKLEDIGVESKLSRAKAYNGAATMHYRVNLETFEALVLNNARNLTLSGNDVLNNAENDVPNIDAERITKTTAETTAETTDIDSSTSDDAGAHGSVVTPRKPRKRNEYADAVTIHFFETELGTNPESEKQAAIAAAWMKGGNAPRNLNIQPLKQGLTVDEIIGVARFFRAKHPDADMPRSLSKIARWTWDYIAAGKPDASKPIFTSKVRIATPLQPPPTLSAIERAELAEQLRAAKEGIANG